MPKLRPWPERSRRSLLNFKVFEVREAIRTSPRTGRDHDFFVLHTLDWVNVVAFDEQDRLLLVRQYRHGTTGFSLEIPGGCIDPGEDPAAAALRELREETGHVGETAEFLGVVHPNPAIQTNRCSTYLVRRCRDLGEGLQMDSGEDIEVVKMSLEEAEQLVLTGELDHALAVAGLYLHRLRETRA
jgi:ADP-ribose pyrophosphatase